MNKLDKPNSLLDEIIDIVHKNVDVECEEEDEYGRNQISTGINKTPELYASIRSVLQKSQSQEKVALHFHIPQARCECGGYAIVYPVYDTQGKASSRCSIMLSCKHEIDDEIRDVALKYYARRIFVIREHEIRLY